MKNMCLNGSWQMAMGTGEFLFGEVPGSVYSILLANGKMEDPYWCDNEMTTLALMENDFTFRRSFTLSPEWTDCSKVLLRCEGLDTVCEIAVNEQSVGKTFNMHRIWELNVTSALVVGENKLTLCFYRWFNLSGKQTKRIMWGILPRNW